MNATVPAPDLRLLAPAFAGRFALIITNLVALIARAFLHDLKLASLIVPLHRRLNRTTRRISALMASLASGRTPQHRTGRSGSGRSGGRAPKPPIPTSHAWLVVTLRHEAAAYASQLSHLLNEPGTRELLAAAPAAGRLLRPLCRMLGIPPAALCAVGSDPATGTQLCVPKAAGCASSRTSDTAPRAVASQATGVFAFKNPESAVASSLTENPAPRPTPPPDPISEATAAPPAPPPRPPPPCPRLAYRWPFFIRENPA